MRRFHPQQLASTSCAFSCNFRLRIPLTLLPCARSIRSAPTAHSLCWTGRGLSTTTTAAAAVAAAAATPHPNGAATVAATADPNMLATHLHASISVRGPISVAEFMRTALTHPTHGYYARDHAVFGRQGDFVTAPEISPLFGELIAVWLVAVIPTLLPPAAGEAGAHTTPIARPSIQLVELGPGKGTLLSDVLRVMGRSFPDTLARIGGVHLVETSPALRSVQARALRCTADHEPGRAGAGATPRGDGVFHDVNFATTQVISSGGPAPGLRVHWHDRFSELCDALPADAGPLLVLAHELFDALPVHQFVRTSSASAPSGYAWRERLVDVDREDGASPVASSGAADHIAAAAVVAASPSAAAEAEAVSGLAGAPVLKAAAAAVELSASAGASAGSEQIHRPPPKFRLVLSPTPTPASAAYGQLLDSGVARARAAVDEARAASARAASAALADASPSTSSSGGTPDGSMSPSSLHNIGDGSTPPSSLHNVGDSSMPPSSLDDGAVVEFSPSAFNLSAEIAAAVYTRGGAALIMDYGHDMHCSSLATGKPSVRGIRDHAFTDSPLLDPGLVDISADVDFGVVQRAAADAARHMVAVASSDSAVAVAAAETSSPPPSAGESAPPGQSGTASDTASYNIAVSSSGGSAACSAVAPSAAAVSNSNSGDSPQAVAPSAAVAAVGTAPTVSTTTTTSFGVFGPISQSALLQSLGLEARVNRLLRSLPPGDTASRQRLVDDAMRLAHPEQMGSIYKALALLCVKRATAGAGAGQDEPAPPPAFEGARAIRACG